MPQHEEYLPDDTPYHWAAFNKLLLLGMYAPVEEAHAAEAQLSAVKQQQQQLAAARKVRFLAAIPGVTAGVTAGAGGTACGPEAHAGWV
jgi:hypothetical protein